MIDTLLHADLSYQVIGAAMDVHNQLGPGWDELVYHRALAVSLQKRSLTVESACKGVILCHERSVHTFVLDLLVENAIILELKHVAGPFAQQHYVQLINYMKFWKMDLGLLINFGEDRLQYKRIPRTPPSGPIEISAINTHPHHQCITVVLETIMNDHGLGYGADIYRAIFSAECNVRNIACIHPCVNLLYDATPVGEYEADTYLIENEVLLIISALNPGCSNTDIAKMKTYLRHMNLDRGCIANFGKDKLEIACIPRKEQHE